MKRRKKIIFARIIGHLKMDFQYELKTTTFFSFFRSQHSLTAVGTTKTTFFIALPYSLLSTVYSLLLDPSLLLRIPNKPFISHSLLLFILQPLIPSTFTVLITTLKDLLILMCMSFWCLVVNFIVFPSLCGVYFHGCSESKQ